MEALLVPMSLLAGGLLALQAGANTLLSRAIGSPFAATLLQLTVATIALSLLALVTGGLFSLASLPEIPWWHAIGGTASALFVLATILLFPRFGAVASVGLIIAGQILASVILDSFGLLGVPTTAFDGATLIGVISVLGGTAAIVLGQADTISGFSASRLGWTMLALVAGAVLPVQGALNGLLRTDIGAPLTVGAVSFLVATLTMAIAAGAIFAFTKQARPDLANLFRMPWWGWLGGFVGALYVTTVFTAIPVMGAAVVVGLTVAGQQIASVFVDRYGWFRLPVRPVTLTRLVGVAFLLAGVVVIKMF